MSAKKFAVILILFLVIGGLTARIASSHAPRTAGDPINFSVDFDEDEYVLLNWTIPQGYYLNREKIAATLNGKPLNIFKPRGHIDRRTPARAEIYRPPSIIAFITDDLPKDGQVLVTYQECADGNFWCATITKVVDLYTLAVADFR